MKSAWRWPMRCPPIERTTNEYSDRLTPVTVNWGENCGRPQALHFRLPATNRQLQTDCSLTLRNLNKPPSFEASPVTALHQQMHLH